VNSRKPGDWRHGGQKKKGARGHASTSEIDYTADETEFFRAIEAWKGRTGKKFPTNSELLGIARDLGYRKPANNEEATT
jgi:hypothetical protein